MNILDFRKHIEDPKIGKIKAVSEYCQTVTTEEEADAVLFTIFQTLLTQKKYATAGVLAWGKHVFNPDIWAVQRIMKAFHANAKNAFPASGSVCKTYTLAALHLLDWLADPENTIVKIISTTGKHAQTNLLGTMKNLHGISLFKLPGVCNADSIDLNDTDKRHNISIIRIREGEDKSEVLQGFHPNPRKVPHPVFGTHERVRLLLDEAEGIALGVWIGVENTFSNVSGVDIIKASAAWNPKDISSKVADLSAPPTGWSDVDVETGYLGSDDWISKDGWHVYRIDAAKTENIRERREVFAGLHTYENYSRLAQKAGGRSLEYFCFGRGIYSPSGANDAIFTPEVLKLMKGEFTFTSPTRKLAGFDTALEGGDKPMLAIGRAGWARSFRRHLVKPNGQKFIEVVNFPTERYVVQLDQFYEIARGRVEEVCRALKKQCEALNIKPEDIIIDKTGNGGPVFSWCSTNGLWSPKINGLDFGDDATNTKVLEEDEKTCAEQYDGVHSELWFASAKLAEFGFLCIAPTCDSDELEKQLLARKYKLSNNAEKLVVEKKRDYKKRMGSSPDESDALQAMVHLSRTTSREANASMKGTTRRDEPIEPASQHPMTTTKWLRDDYNF